MLNLRGAGARPARAAGLLSLCALWALCAPFAQAADGCSVTKEGGKGVVTCEGDVPATTTDGATWADVAADLSQSTSLELTFKDVEFDAGSLSRALGLLSSVPGAGSVAASLQRCGMSDQQAAVAASARVPGSRQLALTLDRCEFYGNSLNLTGALAAQAGLDVTLKVLDSIVEGNRLLAMGAAAAGTTARADIQVADGSSVDRNTVDLLGALAARGDGSLAIQLAASNVTRNKLSGGGLVALGGAGAADVAENGAVVTGNENEARIRVVTENRLATKALDIVLGVAFNESDRDLSASLRELQGDACATLASAANGTADARLPDELAVLLEQVGERLCDGAKASRDFDLASLAPAAEALASDGLQGLAAAGDQLLGTGGALADAARGLTNGTITSAQELAPTLERLTSGVLAGPNSDAAANWLADLLAGAKRWLDTPLRPVVALPGDDGTDRDAGPAPDLGKLVGSIADSIGGGDDGSGLSTGSEAGDAVLGGVGDTISSLVSALTGGSGSGERGAAANATTPGDVLNQLVGTVGGALGQEGLQDVDVSALLPVLGAVVRDPESRGKLPGLIQSIAGGGDQKDVMASVGPLIGAVLKDPQAAAQLPALLGLAQRFGVGLPVGGGGGSGDSSSAPVSVKAAN